jgi:hypothetical protein
MNQCVIAPSKRRLKPDSGKMGWAAELLLVNVKASC